jgi:hypothetical protein
MDKKLFDVLNGKYDNYILPFFWLHGEDDAILLEELEKIYQSGVRAVCLESRPHESFGRGKWWDDLDLIMARAKELGMKVWLLDDKRFPTGYANGLIGKKYPDLRKWHIREEHVDVMGPMKGAALLNRIQADNEESLICAVAYKRTEIGEELSGEWVDLSNSVKGEFLYWDVPDGCYRIAFLYKTRECEKWNQNYIHMIDPDSVNVMLEAVYEPHYRHYKEYFGNTFAGFFSDEPSFGNYKKCDNSYDAGIYWCTLGIPGMTLPWRHDLLDLISGRIGEDARTILFGLWFDIGEKTSVIRHAYMDIVTCLYRDCFSMKLGDWCRKHGVEYIGHIIEDMNAHARLGYGPGHFFRSLDGQDMAGVDVVLHQILPGFSHHVHTAPISGGNADPEFFDYVLGKLGASHSHIQPRKKGRAMCEIYGAYGYGEGLPMMKWLTDHMLVRGINHFVPHAFSPKYPDPDCPPHFYARGNNPQYRDFKVLMDYTNKMSHLFTDGHHVANAAILYHAEAEWSGGRCMLTQVPAKELYDNQIDYDIIPIDTILEDASVRDGKLKVNQESYDCLIIPYAQVLPYEFIKKAAKFKDDGLCVIYVEAFPEKSAENIDISRFFNTEVCSVGSLSGILKRRGFTELSISPHYPLLRSYHYKREDTHLFMFFNESIAETVCTTVNTSHKGKYLQMNLLEDKVSLGETDGNSIKIELEPYESTVVVFSDDLPQNSEIKNEPDGLWQELDLAYDINVATALEYPNFKGYKEESRLVNITSYDEMPEFSGIMRYRTSFTAEGNVVELDLGFVGETCRVKLNGVELGTRICRPYRYDITDVVKQGENHFEIEVANTLVYENKDYFSKWLLLPPSGLIGPVKLLIK